MGVTTTIIPQQINLDDQVDKTFIDYKTVGTDKKITLGKKSINSLAHLDLRATILEVNASITGATQNFSDIFSDADGLLNTVSTGDTTAIYDATNDNYNNENITTPTLSEYTTNTTYELVGNLPTSDELVNKVVVRLRNGNSLNVFCKLTYKYTDTTISDVLGSTTSYDYVDVAYTNPNPTKTVTSIDLYLKVDNGSAGYLSKPTIYYTDPAEKVIYLTYDKANPKSFYGALYSGSTDSEDIGDVDIELYDATDTLLATFTPFTLYTDLSFATDPTYIILRQNDTEISKISKFVFLIE